jgi:hypothetical protein
VEKKQYKIFEFNKFAYLCIPQKNSDNVCFVSSLQDGKSSVARKSFCWQSIPGITGMGIKNKNATLAQLVEQLICNQ